MTPPFWQRLAEGFALQMCFFFGHKYRAKAWTHRSATFRTCERCRRIITQEPR